MSKKYESVEVFTTPFVVTFPNLDSPDDFSDKPHYNLRALFDKTSDLNWYNNALLECATKNNLLDAQGNITIKFPALQDGDAPNCFTNDTGEQYEGHRNQWYLGLRNGTEKPNDEHPTGKPIPFDIVNTDKDSMGNFTNIEANAVYSGCWCVAYIKLTPFHHEKFGLSMILRCGNLQMVGHATPFASSGGAAKSSTVFGNAAPLSLPAGVNTVMTLPSPTTPGQAAQQPMPGQAAPQAQQPMPGQAAYNQQFMGGSPTNPTPPPQMGPNAQGFTYEQWVTAGYNDDQMRAEKIII